MCGRFELSSPIIKLKAEFHIKQSASFELHPNYNISPSQKVLVVTNKGSRHLTLCRWGFIPSWAKDPAIGHKMINARSETVASKPTFKSAFLKQRCLVLADGFYEWQGRASGKIPYYIHLKSGSPFGFAGLCNVWTSAEGETICSCAILTTNANTLLKKIHDRMPVIIAKDKEDLWLDPEVKDQATLHELLRPYPAGEMEMYEVSPRVNYPKYNNPEAIRPVSKG